MTSAPGERESGGNRVPLGDSYIRSFILRSAQQEEALHRIWGVAHMCPYRSKCLSPCSRLLPD
ncbi:unnamed protein product [Spirodela intermedia]|uniref:Uncharacterized protein n=1 Tax=Spirodela intermedia TaxID=51605 RepID=A0A7I8IK02_SPIIN|nr:unnamed protein product [Spirodela intermedia]CAA6658080.1 unnamed protein product [Spirodela intermedia]